METIKMGKRGTLVLPAKLRRPFGLEDGSLLFTEELLEIPRSVAEAGLPTKDLRIIGMHISPTPWTALAPVISAASGNVAPLGRP